MWKTTTAMIGDNPPTATTAYGVDVLEALRQLPDESVHAVVTEPPTWQKRILEGAGFPQNWKSVVYAPMCDMARIAVPEGAYHLGGEVKVQDYIGHLIAVFREVRRVLRKDGTLWVLVKEARANGTTTNEANGMSNKNLYGVPYRFALAMQADGWVWRSAPVWHETNRLPNHGDRPTDVHHNFFFGAHPESGGSYYYDVDSIREEHTSLHNPPGNKDTEVADGFARRPIGDAAFHPKGRNKRSVFAVPHGCWAGAQEGPWPVDLIEPLVRSCVPDGGTVLDPFAGSGTVAAVALGQGKNFIGIDINADAEDELMRRISSTRPPTKAKKKAPQTNPVADMFEERL
jgi:DNA modification methylase